MSGYKLVHKQASQQCMSDNFVQSKLNVCVPFLTRVSCLLFTGTAIPCVLKTDILGDCWGWCHVWVSVSCVAFLRQVRVFINKISSSKAGLQSDSSECVFCPTPPPTSALFCSGLKNSIGRCSKAPQNICTRVMSKAPRKF